MANVNMKCPNCGAVLKVKDDCFVCDYCGAIIVSMADTGCAADFTSLEAFKKRIDGTKKTFILHIDVDKDKYIDDMIIKGKLKLAESYLKDGKFYRVSESLKGVPDTLFAVQRLLFLAEAGAKDELQLFAAYSGDITAFKHYNALVKSCGDENRRIYEHIARQCAENKKINAQIEKGKELINLNMPKEALSYAMEMRNKYPYYARAWELYIMAKSVSDEKYDPSEDLGFFMACPDAEPAITGGEVDYYGTPKNVSPIIYERCRKIKSKKYAWKKVTYKYLITPLSVLLFLFLMLGFWKILEAILG